MALVEKMSDAQLLTEVKRLAACERHATADLIQSLMELDARRLYLGEGCASLFAYCTRVLHLSEHAAYGRIEAARTARQHPAVIDLLRDGSITLTTVTLLKPHLTAENWCAVLEAARHKSKREVELLVATLRPLPDVPASIRKVPEPRPDSGPVVSLLSSSGDASWSERAGRQTGSHSRCIPAAVKRAVWKRDGGRCAFVGTAGRCEETGFLEFRHRVPYADGGRATVENIEIRCRQHNAHEAEQWFGPLLVRESAPASW